MTEQRMEAKKRLRAAVRQFIEKYGYVKDYRLGSAMLTIWEKPQTLVVLDPKVSPHYVKCSMLLTTPWECEVTDILYLAHLLESA